MKEQQLVGTIEKTEVKNFEHPDEVREFPHGRLELVKIGGVIVGRATLEPGWRWSESVKPVVQTDRCEAAHFGYQLSGVIKVRMEDGTEFQTRAGDVCRIAPGHDAWVVGKEPVVAIDFQGTSMFSESE